MPIRYMGTKRRLAGFVREAVDSVQPNGLTADLFSGMGSVAESLAPRWSVLTNDSLTFTSAIARVRFTDLGRRDNVYIANRLRVPYRSHVGRLRIEHHSQLRNESKALDGPTQTLSTYMANAPHVGKSSKWLQLAQLSSASTGSGHYRLASLYFSGGYFSLNQAIRIDALRYAIDSVLEGPDHQLAIAAWLTCVARLINAPGHTAQYLKPTTDNAARRIRRYWRRDVWDCFREELGELRPVGSLQWRRSNIALHGDAFDMLKSPKATNIGLIYADPPYTKDQYSRYYHVYETLYLYDYPESSGQGRYRGNRASTPFSVKTKVSDAFKRLIKAAAGLGVPLILSYPSNGLLHKAGGDLREILFDKYETVTIRRIHSEHSTMGASKGPSVKAATECIYVCS